MCTRIDIDATRTKKLKPTDNIGWKIVEVRNGKYYAPMQPGYKCSWQPGYKYSCDENRETASQWYPYRDEQVGQGFFHLFSTRRIGREIRNAIKAHVSGYKKQYKVVKVFYDKKDFYGVGNGVQFGGYLMDILDKHKNDSTCVKAFTFAKKIVSRK